MLYKHSELIANEPNAETNKFAEDLANSIANSSMNSLQQKQFFENLAILLIIELKSKNPIVVSPRCGFGKTTFILLYLIIIMGVKRGLVNNEVSVRRLETLPAKIFSSDIRLPSDSVSLRTPLPSANASCYRARSGLSLSSYRPCRAHQKGVRSTV